MYFPHPRRELSWHEKMIDGCGPMFVFIGVMVLAVIICGGVR